MSHSEVLVVMPVYNAEPFLKESIASILNQTYPNLKFLIIDDGSTDNSRSISKLFSDPKITLLELPHRGQNYAMNIGIKYALQQNIPYIARMDADDISMPTRIEKQVNLLELNPYAAACSCNCYYIDSQTGKIVGTSTVPISSKLIRLEIKNGLRGIIQGATIFRSDSLNTIGGYRPVFRLSEEIDVFLRLSERYPLINCYDFLYKIRLHNNSISIKNMEENILYNFYALDCGKRRKRKHIERSFDEFCENKNFFTRLLIHREEIVLEQWRSGISNKKLYKKIFAGLLDPRRVFLRIIRIIDNFKYKRIRFKL